MLSSSTHLDRLRSLATTNWALLLSSAALFVPLPQAEGLHQPVASRAAHPLLAMAALALAAPAQAQADTTAPSLSSVTGNDTTITLIYDEALDTSSVPAGSDFTVKVDDAAVSLSSSPVAVSNSAVTLNLAAAVGIGKTVTVSYEVPASNPVQDLAGNDAAKFTDASVTVSGICDRTPAVRTAILGKIAGVTDCASVTSEHLSKIYGILTLSDQSLSSLQANDFSGLSSLQNLDLGENSLSSLDADIFDGLSSLQNLNLSRNSLSSLDADIFSGLSSLQNLDLGENSLSNLDTDIFDGLSSLQELYLDLNSLNSLPEGIFSSEKNLTSLEVLRLANNGLVCLPSDFPYDGVEDGNIEVDVDLPDCFGVSLSVSPTVVREGSEGESITVTAALMAGEPRGNQKRAKTEDTTVTISVVPDTAEEGTDFEAVSSFSLTVAAGSTSQTGTFTLTRVIRLLGCGNAG